MSKKAAWITSIVSLMPIFIFGFVVWKALNPTTAKPQVLSTQVSQSDNSPSGLGVISSDGVPLGNLSDGSNSQSSSDGLGVSSNQSAVGFDGSTNNSSSASPSSSSQATLDPKNFAQYDKYKDGTSAMFGEVKVGTGQEAAAGKTLTVNYSGWLTNGVLFDQNVSGGKPFSFVLGAGSVIAGWEQGLAGMKVGGERLVIVPPSVGYGSAGQGLIPGNAVMVFDVKLLSVK